MREWVGGWVGGAYFLARLGVGVVPGVVQTGHGDGPGDVLIVEVEGLFLSFFVLFCGVCGGGWMGGWVEETQSDCFCPGWVGWWVGGRVGGRETYLFPLVKAVIGDNAAFVVDQALKHVLLINLLGCMCVCMCVCVGK